MNQVRQMIEVVAKALVQNPSEVSLKVADGDTTSIFELKVSDSDKGRLIGKGGSTIEALRNILRAASARHGKRFILEVVD